MSPAHQNHHVAHHLPLKGMLDRRATGSSYQSVGQEAWHYRSFDGVSPTQSSFMTNGVPATQILGALPDLGHVSVGSDGATFRDLSAGRDSDLPSSTSTLTLSPIYDRYWTSDRSVGPYSNQIESLSVPYSSSMLSDAKADAYRKKNAKFEIPEGRTLDNLDSLIASARDDDEAKELKGQKRLLKNREAALQSRQRKKQHTENLEGEKREFMQLVNQYENKLAILTRNNEQLMQEKSDFQWQLEHTDKRARALEEEVVRLRSRLQSVKAGPLHTAQAPPSPSTAASTGYTDFGEDMEITPYHSAGWADFVTNTDYASPLNTTSKMESLSTFAVAERARPSKGLSVQSPPSESGAAPLLLFLIAAGVSISANPCPEALNAIMWSEAFRTAQPRSIDVLRFLLGETSSKKSLDSYSCELLKTLQENLKPGAMHELRILLRNANGRGGSDTTRGCPVSPGGPTGPTVVAGRRR